jgi:hypothetical protein
LSGLSGVLGVHVVLVERGFGFGLVVWMLVVLLFGGFLVIVGRNAAVELGFGMKFSVLNGQVLYLPCSLNMISSIQVKSGCLRVSSTCARGAVRMHSGFSK